MTAQVLNDKLMDSIVGGSSYMSELGGFLQTGSAGLPCLKVSYSKSGNTTNMVAHMDCPLNDKGVQTLIRVAERCGQVTLTAANGSKQVFTADALKAMM